MFRTRKSRKTLSLVIVWSSVIALQAAVIIYGLPGLLAMEGSNSNYLDHASILRLLAIVLLATEVAILAPLLFLMALVTFSEVLITIVEFIIKQMNDWINKGREEEE